MPWKVVKQGEIYKLYNTEKDSFANATFLSRQSALNQSKNWEARSAAGGASTSF